MVNSVNTFCGEFLLNDKDVKSFQLTAHEIAWSRVCFSEYVLEIVGKLTKLWVDSIFEDGGPITSIAKVLKLVYLLAVDEFEGDQLDLISNWFRTTNCCRSGWQKLVKLNQKLANF